MDAPLGDYTIFVKTLTGRVIQLEVSADDTVADLKLKIQDKTDIAPAAQRYIFQAKQLQDDQTMAQCGVRKEAIVNLIVRQDLAPAPPPPAPKVRPAPGQGDPDDQQGGSGSSSRRKGKSKSERSQPTPQPAPQYPQRPAPPQAWIVQPMSRFESFVASLVTLLSVVWSLVAFPFRFVNRVLVVPFVHELTRLLNLVIIRPLRFLIVRPLRYLFTNILPPIWNRVLLPVLRFIFSTAPRFIQRTARSVARGINTYVLQPLVVTPVRALWNHVLYPVLRFVYHIPSYIGRAGNFIYCRALRPIHRYLSVVLRAVCITAPRFVWRATLAPVLRFIGKALPAIQRHIFSPIGRLISTIVQRTLTVLRGVGTAVRESLRWILTRGIPALYRHTLRPLYCHLIYPFLRFVFVTIPNAVADGISATGRFIRDRIALALWNSVIIPSFRAVFVAMPRFISRSIASAGRFVSRRVLSPLWTSVVSPALRAVLISTPRYVGRTIRNASNILYTHALTPLWQSAISPLLRFIFISTPRFIDRSIRNTINFIVNRALSPLWRSIITPFFRFLFVSTPHFIGRSIRNTYDVIATRALTPLWRSAISPLLRFAFISTPRFVDRSIRNTINFIVTRALSPLWRSVITPWFRFLFVSTPRFIGRTIRTTFNFITTRALTPVWRSVLYPVLRGVFVSTPRFIGRSLSATTTFIRARLMVPLWRSVVSPTLRVLFISTPRFVYQRVLTPIGHGLRSTLSFASRQTQNLFRAFDTYLLRPLLVTLLWRMLLAPSGRLLRTALLRVLRLSNTWIFSPIFSRLLYPLFRRSANVTRALLTPVIRRLSVLWLPRGVSSNGYKIDVRPARFMAPNVMIMEDNTLYDIHVHNNTAYQTDCTISIDNVDMGRFRLVPNNRYVITRPVDSAARFVFVTDQARRHVGSIGTDVANFGSIVRVCFYPQAGAVAVQNNNNRQRSARAEASSTAAGDSSTALSFDADAPAAAAGERAPEFVSGGTVLRGRSSQQINIGAPMYTVNAPFATLELRLVGEAHARQQRPHAD